MDIEKLFETSDLYKILGLNRDAGIPEGIFNRSEPLLVCQSLIFFKKTLVKRSYYRLARTFHPDRADEDAANSSSKFSIIHKAYTILSNSESKFLYDQGKTQSQFSQPTVSARWEQNMKTVRSETVEKVRDDYKNSAAEEENIIKEIIRGKGSLTHLLNHLPFMRVEDEDRIIQIVKRLTDSGKIPKTIKLKKIPTAKK